MIDVIVGSTIAVICVVWIVVGIVLTVRRGEHQ